MSGLGETQYCLVAHPTHLRYDVIALAAEDKGSAILYLFFSRSGSAGLNLSLTVHLLSGIYPAYQSHGGLLLEPLSGRSRHDA